MRAHYQDEKGALSKLFKLVMSETFDQEEEIKRHQEDSEKTS